MSEAVFARLPRFDVAAPQNDADADAIEEVLSAAQTAVPVNDPEPLEPAAPDREHEYDAALSALQRAAETLAQESRQVVLQTVCAIASEIFPSLSQHFLAEELARELPVLLEKVDGHAEITAAPDFCEALEAAAHRLGLRADGIRFKARPGMVPGEVQIRWAAGGASYDHARLLSAVLRRFEIEPIRERNAPP